MSAIAIKPDTKRQALDLKLEYAKTGGQRKPKYQVYFLAYLAKDEERVLAPGRANLIDKQFVRILHTQIVERNQDGRYPFALQLNVNDLAKQIIELGRLTAKDQQDFGGWRRFKEPFHLAVFVPFLEDRVHSTLAGLPADRHECNYSDERALLFQPLPYTFSIHFGIVQGMELPEGTYSIQLNQPKPAHGPADRPKAAG